MDKIDAYARELDANAQVLDTNAPELDTYAPEHNTKALKLDTSTQNSTFVPRNSASQLDTINANARKLDTD